MNLKHLTDKALLSDTKYFVSKEREMTTKILHHLREIDKRKLYSEVRCSSLFEYAVKELGYAEASAHRRIQAARLLEEMPELEEKIESGSLSLSNIAQVQSYFKQNSITDKNEKKSLLTKVQDLSKSACEKKLFELSGKEIKATETTKRISSSHNQVSIILSDETLAKLDYLKGLIGNNLSMDELIGFMSDEAIKTKEKTKFKLSTKTLPPVKVTSTKRNIPSLIKRTVYLRDKCCRKCGSNKYLNFDHIRPFALGGDTSAENLRLLCGQCNQRQRMNARL